MAQESLARAAGISLRHYIRIERGDVDPSVVVACQIAAALRMTVEELFPPRKRAA